MLVSIVTVYYNRSEQVVESINSLLNQTYKNIEVIAVDDGSSDDTLEKLRSIKDKRLKVLTHENKGFVQSIRKAIEHTKGDIIAIHGSGDISYPNRIEKQLKVLKENEKIGVVGCYVEHVNKVDNYSRIIGIALDGITDITSYLLKKNIFTHGEVMFRKEIYDKVGGYRDFFKYTQDYDLWLRMSLHTQFYVIKEVLYKRYTLPDGVSAIFEKKIMQKFFSEMAKQCIEKKRDTGKDLIEEYGVYAPFFRKRSKRLAKNLWRLSVTSFVTGNIDDAKRAIGLSLNEKKIFINLSTALILELISKSKLFTKYITKALLILMMYYLKKRDKNMLRNLL